MWPKSSIYGDLRVFIYHRTRWGLSRLRFWRKKCVFVLNIFFRKPLTEIKIEPKSLVPISAFLLWFSSLRGNCILGGKRMITWCFVDAFFFLEIWYPKFMYATNQLLLSTKKVYSFVSNRKCDFNFIGCNLTVHVYMCVIACKCNVFHQTLTTPETEKWQDKYVSLNNLITV